MAGFVTSDGAYAAVGGVLHLLPAEPMTLSEWAAAMGSMIDVTPDGLPDVCPECGGDVCDCVDVAKLLAALEADPHGQLDRSVEIPF